MVCLLLSAFGQRELVIIANLFLTFMAFDFQADAYAGYDAIYATGKVTEAGCWAHTRRTFHDIYIASPTPITTHVLVQIAAL